MFDASAWELADVETEFSATDCDPAPGGPEAAALWPSHPAALALAACAACHRAFGTCAMESARTGTIPPVLALRVCTSMQRMAQRAIEHRATSLAGYAAYVLLGQGRSAVSRQGDLLDLAERMR